LRNEINNNDGYSENGGRNAYQNAKNGSNISQEGYNNMNHYPEENQYDEDEEHLNQERDMIEEDESRHNNSGIDHSKQVHTGKLKSEGLYRRINRIYLRDLDIFYTFKDSLTSYFQYLRKTQEITQQDG